MKENYPQKWQEIPWNEFPLNIEIDGRILSLGEFNEHYNIRFRKSKTLNLSPEMVEKAIDGFNWNYLNYPGMYMGKCISLGLFYRYPRCCIYSFNFENLQQRHPLAMSYVRYCENKPETGAWVLCHDCASYVATHGIESYLKNQAWEQSEPQTIKKISKTRKNRKS